MSLFARITGPTNLSELSTATLAALTEEIRAFLIDRVFKADVIENSHALTALSYADGLAKAFALRGEALRCNGKGPNLRPRRSHQDRSRKPHSRASH